VRRWRSERWCAALDLEDDAGVPSPFSVTTVATICATASSMTVAGDLPKAALKFTVTMPAAVVAEITADVARDGGGDPLAGPRSWSVRPACEVMTDFSGPARRPPASPTSAADSSSGR
jgi:hypothetical protein